MVQIGQDFGTEGTLTRMIIKTQWHLAWFLIAGTSTHSVECSQWSIDSQYVLASCTALECLGTKVLVKRTESKDLLFGPSSALTTKGENQMNRLTCTHPCIFLSSLLYTAPFSPSTARKRVSFQHFPHERLWLQEQGTAGVFPTPKSTLGHSHNGSGLWTLELVHWEISACSVNLLETNSLHV